ncbi:MAG TPA: hypothetical protein VN900_16685, partial [Stellaceae bacterium]|nr:hypothetical protein [Stellaceae bacterium]
GGTLGKDQLEWLEADLKGKSASTPIVVMAHIPLWPIYPQWGWTTGDAPDDAGAGPSEAFHKIASCVHCRRSTVRCRR